MQIELPEGSGATKLRHVIKALGYNKDVDIEYGTVTAAPVLRIKLDNESHELDGDDFDICEHLTEHTRTAMINGGPYTSTIVFDGALSVGDRVVVASFNAGQRYLILDRVIAGGGG